MTAKAKETNVAKVNQAEVEPTRDKPVFIPATDIYETKDSIVLMADMPGVSQDKVDIVLEDDVLTVSGEQCSCEPEGHQLLHQGYQTGIYRRSFTVLSDIVQDNISAKINNGVLKIVLPKPEKKQPKKIEVKTA